MKKIASLLMAVLMVFVFVPESVFAEESDAVMSEDVSVEEVSPYVYKIIPNTDGFLQLYDREEEGKPNNRVLYHDVNGEYVQVAEPGNKDYYQSYDWHLFKDNTYYLEAEGAGDLSFESTSAEFVVITFDANGGSYNKSERLEYHLKKGESLDFGQSGIVCPQRDGYTFSYDYENDWNTKEDGTGFKYREYDAHFSKDMVFYAVWHKVIHVTFDANGGFYKGSIVDPDTDDYIKRKQVECSNTEEVPGEGVQFYPDVLYMEGADYTLIPPDDTVVLKGWNSKQDGSGNSYGLKPNVFDDTILYAIWGIETPEIRLSATSFTYDYEVKTVKVGKKKKKKAVATVQKPGVIVYVNGKRIKSRLYNVDWSDKESADIGEYTVTVTLKGGSNGKATATYTINPKGVSLKKVAKAKKKFTASWKKLSKNDIKYKVIGGYQLRYSTNPEFPDDNTKVIKAGSIKSASKAVKKLKAKTKYYVQLRTYKKIGGKTFYSSWSKTKSVTTK